MAWFVTAVHTALVQSLVQAASPQIRNMATIGGNLLQRTRCPYFRDAASVCNKRRPGSGCSALRGDRHGLAILGTSDHCLATYPGDLAVALVALNARVELRAQDGIERILPVQDLHVLPGDTPNIETVLAPGELITAVQVPHRSDTKSVYIKTRERASYAFALASCAVDMRLDDEGRVEDIRIALGGIATKPWRCEAAEALATGKRLDAVLVAAVVNNCLSDVGTSETARHGVAARTIERALEQVFT